MIYMYVYQLSIKMFKQNLPRSVLNNVPFQNACNQFVVDFQDIDLCRSAHPILKSTTSS